MTPGTLCLFVTGSRADDAFVGTWKISEGRTLNNKEYTGTVRIAGIGPVYQLQWKTTAGDYRGLGLADGNRLCTGWGGKNFGVVLYQINGDGTLSGRWTVPEVNEAQGTEEAIGGATGEIEGEYSVKGTNPGGKGAYTGKLRITKNGETFRLRWTIGEGESYEGVGLKAGNALHVGWGVGKEPYAVISYQFENGGAAGVLERDRSGPHRQRNTAKGVTGAAAGLPTPDDVRRGARSRNRSPRRR